MTIECIGGCGAVLSGKPDKTGGVYITCGKKNCLETADRILSKMSVTCCCCLGPWEPGHVCSLVIESSKLVAK